MIGRNWQNIIFEKELFLTVITSKIFFFFFFLKNQKKRKSHRTKMDLFDKGFCIKYRVFDEDLIKNIKEIAEKYEDKSINLFLNASLGIDDPNRSQFIIPSTYKEVISKIKSAISNVTFDLNANWVTRDPTILYSRPNGEVQQIHRDYLYSDMTVLDDEGIPGGVVIGISDDTKLLLYGWNRLEALKDEETEVTLRPGDACFFIGPTIHAGAKYSRKNIRLHCFLDIPGGTYERNVTQPVVFFQFKCKNCQKHFIKRTKRLQHKKTTYAVIFVLTL